MVLSVLDSAIRPFSTFLITGKAVNALGLTVAPGEFRRCTLQFAEPLPRRGTELTKDIYAIGLHKVSVITLKTSCLAS